MKRDIFSLPASQRFYEGDAGGGSGGGLSSSEAPKSDPVVHDESSPIRTDDLGKVEGMVKPDFSFLGKKTEETPPAKKEDAPPPEAKKADEPPPGETADQKADRLRDEAGRFKKGEDKGETKPEFPKKKVEEKKADEPPPKAEEKKVEEQKPDRDKDLEDLKPAPNAPQKVHVDFAAMRTKIKESRDLADKLAKEKEDTAKLAEELKGKVGKMPEETEKELTELRAIRAAYLGENDPKFQEEWTAKAKAADTALIDLLEQNNLPADQIKALREGGIDKWATPAKLEEIETLCTKQKLGLLWKRIEMMLIAREDVGTQRAAAVKQIQSDPGSFFKKHQEQEQATLNQFADVGRARTLEIVKEHPDLFKEQEMPENASKEQKAVVEAHNAGIKEMAGRVRDRISAMHGRDPKAIIEAAMHQERAAHLDKKLADVNAELQKSKDRIKELEDKIASSKKAGKTTHSDSSAPIAEKMGKGVVQGVGGDVRDAFASWKPKK